MKFDKNKAFPYPVLRPYSDDFVDKEFQATSDFTIEGNTVTVEVNYVLSSKDIKKLITEKAAVYVSVIACRDTYFSVSMPSSETHIKRDFENNLLRGEVEIRSYIHIINDVDFLSSEVHPEFGSEPIKYTVGDIIAQDETQSFYFERDLFKPISSVFDLVKRDTLIGGAWELKFDQDHVHIEVSPSMKESIDNARNNPTNKVILTNSILFAAVMQSIEKLKSSEENYEDYKWAQIITNTALNNSIDLKKDSYEIAEKLMKHPLSMLDAYVFRKGAE